MSKRGAAFGFLTGLALTVGGSAYAADQPNAELVARGKYLSDAGDCMACHTKEGGEMFAGGRYLPTPFGPLPTANITPDPETGIGKWSDDEFYRVFHEGIGKNGEYIYPAMPYPFYTKVTREDILAIKAYLMTVKPVNSPPQPNKMSFPFNIRTGLLAWQQAFFRVGTFQPDPSKSEEVNRGAYLVEGLGHCGACHNGRALLGNSSLAQSLRGGMIQDWYAPNLSSNVHEGVGKYSDEQLVSYLKTGQAQGVGVASGPMAETVQDSLSKLTDADLKAMVAYLKSTPSEASYAATEKSDYTGPQPAGRETYLSYCSSCHQTNGRGIEGAVATLVNDSAVLAGGPQDMIRVILSGIEAKGTASPMPAVGQGMTDQQIADAINYVRQAWDNKAPPNADPGMVAKLRTSTTASLYGSPSGSCPELPKGPVADAIVDPHTGIEQTLKATNAGNVLQSAEAVVPKIRAAVPKASQADIVNQLTIAYCPVVRADTTLEHAQKVVQLNQFSGRVYTDLQTGGKN